MKIRHRIYYIILFITLVACGCMNKIQTQIKGVLSPIKFTPAKLLKENPPYNKSYAIVIGVNKYPQMNSRKQLQNAKNDALAIMEYLKTDENFDEVKTLFDKQATLNNIKKNIKELCDRAENEDRIVIFFSGHGQTIGGEGYLIPYDGSLENAFVDGYRLGEITTQLKSITKAKHALIIVDACYTGPGYETKGELKLNKKILEAYVKRPYLGVLSAASSDETAIEDSESPYSLFSRFLIQGLRHGTADLNNDYLITINELYEYVRSQVLYKSIDKYGHRQTPQYKHIFGEGEFVFMRKNSVSDKTDATSVRNPKATKGDFKLALLDVYSSSLTMTGDKASLISNLLQQELKNSFLFLDKETARAKLDLDKPEGEIVTLPNLILRDYGWSLNVDKVATAVIVMINNQVMISLNVIDVKTGLLQNRVLVCNQEKLEPEIAEFIKSLKSNL